MKYNESGHEIQTAAAIALANWKAEFAHNVAIKAKEIAARSGRPSLITVHHYRQAAREAVQMLARTIESSNLSDGHQEAA